MADTTRSPLGTPGIAAFYLRVGAKENPAAVREAIVRAGGVAIMVPAVVEFQRSLEPARSVPQLGPPGIFVERICNTHIAHTMSVKRDRSCRVLSTSERPKLFLQTSDIPE